MKRLLPPVVLVLAATLVPSAQTKKPAKASAPQPPFTIVEASIADMRTAMEERRVTSRELVQQCLVRIATYEERLNAVMTVNPKALEEAEALDRERAQGKVRGPLHGIPIAL
jgi:transcriptional regulator NrdR family protein